MVKKLGMVSGQKFPLRGYMLWMDGMPNHSFLSKPRWIRGGAFESIRKCGLKDPDTANLIDQAGTLGPVQASRMDQNQIHPFSQVRS